MANRKTNGWARISRVELNRMRHEADVRELKINDLQRALDMAKRNNIDLEQRLSEARRRTLPLADGTGEINFLPLAVSSIDIRYAQPFPKDLWPACSVPPGMPARAVVEIEGRSVSFNLYNKQQKVEQKS